MNPTMNPAAALHANMVMMPGAVTVFGQRALERVGSYFIGKTRERIAAADVQTVARQLRKQGVPLGIALLLVRAALQ